MEDENTITLGYKPHCVNPYNAQNIGRREQQQDYFSFSDVYNDEERERIGAVAVLADGMGGMQNGAVASRAAVDTFMDEYINMADHIPNTEERMHAALIAANNAVKEISGAGSTLCAVVIKDWKLHWISVGDSRIYLYRNGALRRLNNEHNFKNVLDRMAEMGQITREEAETDTRAEMLTSYLGMDELNEIDVNCIEFPLFLGDSIMMCSDGLYRELSNNEMAYILENADENVCDDLVNAALGKNDIHQDNITVTLMDID